MKNTKKKNIKFKSTLMAISIAFTLKCTVVIQNLDVNINVNVINQNIIEKN